MRRKLHRHRRPADKIGVPPGTLVHVGERKAEKTRIRLINYTAEHLQEYELERVEQCLDFGGEAAIRWLNIDGIHDIAVIEEVGRCFGIHPLVQEDILNTGQRPKLEDYGDYLFLVVKMLQLDSGNGLRTEQISCVLGPGFVLTFQEQEGDVFAQVRERLRASKGRIRRLDADYLAYTLLDAIIDSYFIILEDLGDRIEALEDELVAPTPDTLQKIHQFKREMIHLRKSIWPLREVIAALQRQEPPLMQEGTRLFLRDVYDHTIQIIDTVETYRDIVAGMLDLYLSSLSHRMNEVMKVLTIIATIFIPLTFIAGVYGMNFDYLPELHWKWSYPVLWLFMLAIVVGMLVFFRKKKWL